MMHLYSLSYGPLSSLAMVSAVSLAIVFHCLMDLLPRSSLALPIVQMTSATLFILKITLGPNFSLDLRKPNILTSFLTSIMNLKNSIDNIDYKRLLLLFCIAVFNFIICFTDSGFYFTTAQLTPYFISINMCLYFLYYIIMKVGYEWRDNQIVSMFLSRLIYFLLVRCSNLLP